MSQPQKSTWQGPFPKFLKMDRIREWPAVSLAIAGGVGILLIGRALSRKRDTLTITVPATTANLACGFDVFGAAFEFRMIVQTRLAPPAQTETRFSYEGEGADEVSTCESNLIWQSALACIKMHAPGRTMPKLNVSVKVLRSQTPSHPAPRHSPTPRLPFQNPVPFGRGLGSSATAIAAGVVLANEYLGLRLSHEQLLDAALQMENHPDNLAAALWGGAVASGVSEGGR
jgi:homoserine kinase